MVTHKLARSKALCGQHYATSLSNNDENVTCKKCRGLLEPKTEGIEITNPTTGEILPAKAYRTEDHLSFGGELLAQQAYVRDTVRDPDHPDAFAKMTPEQIIDFLDHLSAYYERLGNWIANQTLWHSDLKTQLELKYAQSYLEWKRKKGETNETARMEAKLATNHLSVGIDKCKHQLDTVVAWKKSIGRYHDAARSQLSYEKQNQYMQRRNDNQPEYRRP